VAKKMKHIALLGSTGSIGTSTLEVIGRNEEEFKLVALAGGENIDLLARQIKRFAPQMVGVKRLQDAKQLREQFPDLHVVHGSEGLLEIVSLPEVDTMVSAIDGTTALEATLASIRRGHRVCLANKETLVAAGALIEETMKTSPAEIIPIDSEQSAIFQCLGEKNGQGDEVRKVILTASGGPFFRKNKEEFKHITLNEALNHPTWSMGTKITIDSATLMNKALEIIEAYYLFRLRSDQIDVVIHPQSIVHSMVEFIDSSVIAQMSVPDMKLPILYSLSYPRRISFNGGRLSFVDTGKLEFFPVDRDKFVSIPMAFHALEQGKNAGAVLNAANEKAVEYFLQQKIRFNEIFAIVAHIFYNENFYTVNNVEDIIQSVETTKRKTEEYIKETIVD
jgi:1-deoxy-D-xylulose-5-phosphate reductoisomerase